MSDYEDLMEDFDLDDDELSPEPVFQLSPAEHRAYCLLNNNSDEDLVEEVLNETIDFQEVFDMDKATAFVVAAFMAAEVISRLPFRALLLRVMAKMIETAIRDIEGPEEESLLVEW